MAEYQPRDELDREILVLHGQGMTDTEISQQLARPRKTISYRIKRLGLRPNTLRNTRSASVGRPEAISHDLVQDLDIDRVRPALDIHDAPQAHLDPQQITDMAPIFRRRELAPDEIEEAMKSLAEGEELSTICQRLGVTPATLRQQVLQTLWNCWTAVHGLPQSRCPQALDF